ncbi:MAG: GxxExxY protein [Bacteroidaceae bacterium]|nr:GxxExxY protein [Bacteroidaceae bacterium]
MNDRETYAIIGACMDVHRELNCGFKEHVYQKALALEFSERMIPFQQEVKLQVYYKGLPLEGAMFRADFLCYDSVIVELKALPNIIPDHVAQILNYMHIGKISRGLLVNFGSKNLQVKRFVI